MTFLPVIGAFIWVGGGLGTIVVIVLIVVLIKKL